MYKFVNHFASVYGSSSYDTDSYNGSAATTGTSTATGSGSATSVLANTGLDLIIGVTIACIVIFAALLIRFWKKPSNRSRNNIG